MDTYTADESMARRYRTSPSLSELPHSAGSPDKSMFLSMKSALEREYEEKLNFAKTKYEERLESLSTYTRQFYDEVRTDEALNAMRNDPTSEPFVNARITEIYDDTLATEREMTIDKLNQELVEVKGRLLNTESELTRQEMMSRKFEDAFHREEAKAELMNRELNEERIKFARVQKTLEEGVKSKEAELRNRHEESMIDLNSMGLELRKTSERCDYLTTSEKQKHLEIERLYADLQAAQNKIQTLGSQLSNTQRSYENANSNLDTTRGQASQLEKENVKMITQISSLKQQVELRKEAHSNLQKDRDDAINQQNTLKTELKEMLDDMNKQGVEQIQNMSVEHKSKSRQFKRKIIDQKKDIENLRAESRSKDDAMNEITRNHERTIKNLTDDLQHVKDEWSLKCKELEQDAEKAETALHEKYSEDIKNLQTHYQEILDKRITDIQSDSTSQLQRAKEQEIELREMLQDKIRKMENDYVEKVQHDDKIASLENSHADVVNRMSLEMDDLLRQTRTQEAQKSDELHEAYRSQKNLETRLEESFSRQRSDMSLLQLEHEKDKQLLQETIDKVNRDVKKQKSKKANEKQSKKQYKTDFESYQQKLKDLQTQYDERRVAEAAAVNQYESQLRSQQSENEQIIEQESNRCKQLSEELSCLLEKHTLIENEKDDLKTELEKVKEQQSLVVEAQEFSLREEGSKVDREKNEHLSTKQKLIAAETQLSTLSTQVKDEESRSEQWKRRYTDSEHDLTRITSRAHDAEARISQLEIDLRDSERKSAMTKSDLVDSHMRMQKLVKFKNEKLRSELNNLRTVHKVEVESLNKDLENIADEIQKFYTNQMKKVREEYDAKLTVRENQIANEWKHKLSIAESDTANSYQKKIDEQKSLITMLEKRKDSIKSEMDTVTEAYEETKMRHNNELQRCERLESEVRQLNDQLHQNSTAFDQLQEDVELKTTRLREANEAALEDSRNKLGRKFKIEFEKMSLTIGNLKSRHARELEIFESEVYKMQTDHKTELKRLKISYEKKLEKYDQELECETQRSQKLQDGLIALDNQTNSLQSEQNKALRAYEEKLENLQEGMNQELDKHIKFKLVKNQNIEELTKQLKDLTRELQGKMDQIEAMRHESELQKSASKDREFELRAKEGSLQRELNTALAAKESEIAELQGALSSRYVSSVDRTSELDRETRELSGRVHRPIRESDHRPLSRSERDKAIPPLSMSQLRASPFKK